MLLSPDMLLPSGPPPQSVLDQRWMWYLLIFLLAVTFCLRLVGLDIAGAMLSGLMLCFGIIMTRDGMQEMAKYALVYAVLCGLNFFFDILPLITELGGRVTSTTELDTPSTDNDGYTKTTYTMTTKTTPFFDRAEGWVYNVQSLSMILSPICMALGTYLSISAHNEIQRLSPSLFDDDDILGFGRQVQAPVQAVRQTAAQSGPTPRPMAGSNANRVPAGNSARDTFERFQGQSHKLTS